MAEPKLVVIDDELEFTKALDQFFSARGYDVHVALRGQSGLRLIETERPDVVLMDLKMPGMDGDEILRRIHLARPEIKIIVITAYDDGATKQRLLAMGAFAHLEKPLQSIAALAQTVKLALASSGPPASPNGAAPH